MNEPKALSFVRKDVARAQQDIRNIAGMLKAGDLQIQAVLDRMDRLETKLDELTIGVDLFRIEATRIRYKAAREIRQSVKERLETLGLPPEKFRSNFYAAMRREFGGVNSYHDLPEVQVREIHAFIVTWRPTPEDVARLMGKREPRVVTAGKRWVGKNKDASVRGSRQ